MTDDDVIRLRIALARISKLLDRQVDGSGMTRTQLSMLGTVARHKSLRIGELADLESLNPTMVSRLVGKLEVAGFVTRAPDAEDRRSIIVTITTLGSRMHTKLRQQRTRLLATTLDSLGADQAATLAAALEALESLAEGLRPAVLTSAGAGA